MFFGDLVYNIEMWEQQAAWRSWAIHAGVGAALGFVGGPGLVFAVFAIREAEQFLHRLKNDVPSDWIDVFMDVFSPVVVSVALAAFFPAFA
jgi:hypothetical protein